MSLRSSTIGWILLVLQSIAPIRPARADDDHLFDFGISDPRRIILHSYPIRNDQARALEIERAGVTCGCVTVRSFPKLIAPGEQGTVQVALDTTALQGYVTQKVTLVTNRETEPQMELEIRGVVRDVWVTHPTLDLGMITYPGAIPESTVRLSSAGLTQVRVTAIELPPFLEFVDKRIETLLRETNAANDAAVDRVLEQDVKPLEQTSSDIEPTLDFVETDRAHHMAYLFRVRCLPDRVPQGSFRGKIRIQTSAAAQNPLEILVTGTVSGPVRAEPAVVFLGTVSSQAKTERQVRLVVSEGAAIDLKSATVSSDHAGILPLLRTTNGETILTVETRPDHKLQPGLLSGFLNVANEQGENLARIRFSGFVRK